MISRVQLMVRLASEANGVLKGSKLFVIQKVLCGKTKSQLSFLGIDFRLHAKSLKDYHNMLW